MVLCIPAATLFAFKNLLPDDRGNSCRIYATSIKEQKIVKRLGRDFLHELINAKHGWRLYYLEGSESGQNSVPPCQAYEACM